MLVVRSNCIFVLWQTEIASTMGTEMQGGTQTPNNPGVSVVDTVRVVT